MTEQDTAKLAATVRGLMPQLTDELRDLVAIPSVSVAGYPASTHDALGEAQHFVTQLLRDAGCETVDTIELPDTAPVVFAAIPAPTEPPPSCSTATTTSSQQATSRSGSLRRSSRPSGTARSTAAAPPTPSRTSWRSWAPCAPGTAGRPSA